MDESSDVVTGMLRVFDIDLYTLLDLGVNMLFFIPYYSIKFDVFTKVLLEPYSINTTIGESVPIKKVYKNYP